MYFITLFQTTSYDLLGIHFALSGGDDKTIEQLYAKHSSMLKTSLHQAHPQLDILPADRIAEKFLPSTETTYRSLSSPADGNCFFDAVSLKLTGSTALAGTLRLLTAIEMRTINYLPHPISETSMALPCSHQWETHMSMLISDDEVEHTRHEAGDLQALQHLVAETSKDSYWVGHIHFLAQVKDYLSDLESLSSEECDTESSLGDKGDNQDEVPTSIELARTFQKDNETTILWGIIKTVDWWIFQALSQSKTERHQR